MDDFRRPSSKLTLCFCAAKRRDRSSEVSPRDIHAPGRHHEFENEATASVARLDLEQTFLSGRRRKIARLSIMLEGPCFRPGAFAIQFDFTSRALMCTSLIQAATISRVECLPAHDGRKAGG
jgi:hypothetical protein